MAKFVVDKTIHLDCRHKNEVDIIGAMFDQGCVSQVETENRVWVRNCKEG